MFTAHHMCEANKYTTQPKDDDLTEHYEFNWCLRSPLGVRLLMSRATQYHKDLLRTRWGEQAIVAITSIHPTTFSLTARTRPYVTPQILYHKPGSCYYLRQAPASSPSLLYFAEDFAQGAGFLLLFTTSTRLLIQLLCVSLRFLHQNNSGSWVLVACKKERDLFF